MAEPEHSKIGPLEEIGPDILDTAPDAYTAKWSAESRHVALFYRAARHILAMRLYRVENRRAYPVVGPALLNAAVIRQAKVADVTDPIAGSTQLTWLDDRFHETAQSEL
jgi:hypothetical protein